MAAFTCNLCEQKLRPCCGQVDVTMHGDGSTTSQPNSRCDWWKCTNTECTAVTYDVTRGILVYRDGHREQLGA